MAAIWVYSDNQAVLAELISGARALGGEKPVALVVDSQQDADTAAALGADVYLLSGGVMPEDYVETIEALVRDKKPAGLFFGSTITCRALSARLAARLGIDAFSDVKSMDSNFVASQLVYGGGAARKIKSTGEQFIALFAPSSFAVEESAEAGSVVAADFVAPAWTVTRVSSREKDCQSIDLSSSKSIVAIGRGVGKEADLAMIRELADLLGAEIGCTRPIAENNGWLPTDTYIGISGTFVKPELFVAIGISGQVQHTVGVADAKNIVVINKDADCVFMGQADYSIACDLYEVVPALIQALKQ